MTASLMRPSHSSAAAPHARTMTMRTSRQQAAATGRSWLRRCVEGVATSRALWLQTCTTIWVRTTWKTTSVDERHRSASFASAQHSSTTMMTTSRQRAIMTCSSTQQSH